MNTKITRTLLAILATFGLTLSLGACSFDGSTVTDASTTSASQDADAARKAQEAASALFGGAGLGGSIPTTEITREDLTKDARVTSMLALTKLAPSNSAARRLIEGGGVAVNDVKVTDVNAVLTEDMFAGEGVMLRSGKKKFHLFTLA